MCIADKKIVENYVTGKPMVIGCVKCTDKNTDGKCKDYIDVRDYIDELIGKQLRNE